MFKNIYYIYSISYINIFFYKFLLLFIQFKLYFWVINKLYVFFCIFLVLLDNFFLLSLPPLLFVFTLNILFIYLFHLSCLCLIILQRKEYFVPCHHTIGGGKFIFFSTFFTFFNRFLVISIIIIFHSEYSLYNLSLW